MKERVIIPVSVKDGQGNLDFGPWARGIDHYPDSMLPVTPEDLSASFNQGLAIALIDPQTNEVMGGSRFVPLLDNELKEKMGLDKNFPQIWEMGSVIIFNSQVRGNGFSLDLNKALLDSVRQKTEAGELLVIGTTKSIVLLSTLKKEGLNFSFSSHTEFPLIAPLTCICTGEMGQGFQESTNCSFRVSPEQIANLPALADKKGKVPCTLFVSSKQLAQKIDGELRTRFLKDDPVNPQRAEVELLKTIGYYR